MTIRAADSVAAFAKNAGRTHETAAPIHKDLRMLQMTCPTCQAKLQARPEKAGLLVACPKCKGKIRVPGGVPEPPPSQPAKTVAAASTSLPAKSGPKPAAAPPSLPVASKSSPAVPRPPRPLPPPVRDDANFEDLPSEEEERPRRRRQVADRDDGAPNEPADAPAISKPVWNVIVMLIGFYWICSMAMCFMNPQSALGFLMLVGGGGALILVANLYLIVLGFRESLICGLLVWFIPFYAIFFFFTRYRKAWPALRFFVLGCLFFASLGVLAGLASAGYFDDLR